MRLCPHCGQPVRNEYALCPFCGADVETGEKTDRAKRIDPAAGVNGATTLGCGLMFVIYYLCGAYYTISGNMLFAVRDSHSVFARQDPSQWLFWRTYGPWIGFGVPVLITGLPYLLLRRRFPAFARGLGYSALVAIAMALGAPFLCGHNR